MVIATSAVVVCAREILRGQRQHAAQGVVLPGVAGRCKHTGRRLVLRTPARAAVVQSLAFFGWNTKIQDNMKKLQEATNLQAVFNVTTVYNEYVDWMDDLSKHNAYRKHSCHMK